MLENALKKLQRAWAEEKGGKDEKCYWRWWTL